MKLLFLAAIVSFLLASASAFVVPRAPKVRTCDARLLLASVLRGANQRRGKRHHIVPPPVQPAIESRRSTDRYMPPPSSHPQPAASAARTSVRLNAEGPSFFEWGSRFLNELLPWGDSSKGLWAGKRDAMVEK